MTTIAQELTEKVKKKYGVSSNYAVSKITGVSEAKLSTYKSRNLTLTPDDARLFAVALDLQLDKLIVKAALEKAKNPETLKELKKLTAGYSIALAGLIAFAPVQEARASGSFNLTPDIHYAKF